MFTARTLLTLQSTPATSGTLTNEKPLGENLKYHISDCEQKAALISLALSGQASTA